MSEPCPFCLNDVRISAWDQVIGLPARCRRCGGFSGPAWPSSRLFWAIAASLLLNGLIFFFVARPLRALFLLVFHICVVGALLVAAAYVGSDGLAFTSGVAFFLGPACISTVEFWRHEVETNRPPSVEPEREHTEPILHETEGLDQPRFLGTEVLIQLRNQLEISIYHEKDRLEWLAKGSCAIAALAAGVAALESDWLTAAGFAILFGTAYTVASRESRAFAILYLTAGLLLTIRMFQQLVMQDDRAVISMPSAVVVTGASLVLSAIRLNRLRRMRQSILLEPAEHLSEP